MKAGRGVISGDCGFRRLLHILLTLALLIASAVAIPKRSEAFVGYAEKNELHSNCVDSMAAEACASYKESRMCKTGVVRPKLDTPGINEHPPLSDRPSSPSPFQLALGICRLCEDGMQKDLRALLKA